MKRKMMMKMVTWRGLNDLPDDPDALMDAIIALDDLHKAGELPEEAYQQRRAALKDRLSQVVGKAT
jgi:hypothetical protein